MMILNLIKAGMREAAQKILAASKPPPMKQIRRGFQRAGAGNMVAHLDDETLRKIMWIGNVFAGQGIIDDEEILEALQYADKLKRQRDGQT